MKNGRVHIYTGDGKGKTSAALGMVVRAVGAGLRVYFCQFAKRQRTSEILSLEKRFPEVTVRQFGVPGFVDPEPTEKQVASATSGLRELRTVVASGEYDLVIADEACTAEALGLLGIDELVEVVEGRAPGVEMILTGRLAHRRLVSRADLVTRMRKTRHYYDRGVKARKGIEY